MDKMHGRVSPRTSLKVVFTSCSGCFQSQNTCVKNADAPVISVIFHLHLRFFSKADILRAHEENA